MCNKCRGASAWTKYKNQNFFCDVMQENVHVWCVFPVCLLLFCLRCNTESEWHQIHENIIKKANSRYNLSGSNTGEKQDASFKVLEKLRARLKDVKTCLLLWLTSKLSIAIWSKLFLPWWKPQLTRCVTLSPPDCPVSGRIRSRARSLPFWWTELFSVVGGRQEAAAAQALRRGFKNRCIHTIRTPVSAVSNSNRLVESENTEFFKKSVTLTLGNVEPFVWQWALYLTWIWVLRKRF